MNHEIPPFRSISEAEQCLASNRWTLRKRLQLATGIVLILVGLPGFALDLRLYQLDTLLFFSGVYLAGVAQGILPALGEEPLDIKSEQVRLDAVAEQLGALFYAGALIILGSVTVGALLSYLLLGVLGFVVLVVGGLFGLVLLGFSIVERRKYSRRSAMAKD